MWRSEDISLTWITGALVVTSVSIHFAGVAAGVLFVFSEWFLMRQFSTPRPMMRVL